MYLKPFLIFLLGDLFKRMFLLENSNNKDLKNEAGLVSNEEYMKRGEVLQS